MINKISYYLNWAFQASGKRRQIPLTSSIILTDKCNLSCQHCIVSNLGYPDLSFSEVTRDIETLYKMGSRMLVITGGEPFLWHDDKQTIEDVIDFAKKLGFFRIVVCTNGTYELKSRADYLWVSLDGFPKEHNRIRGHIYEKVQKNIDTSQHKRIYINFTISKVNIYDLESSVEDILKRKNIRGILFHLFTPYLGLDRDMMLSMSEKEEAINKIHKIKRRHPSRVSNTFDGIKMLKHNSWERPVSSSVVINQGKIGPCCCRKGIYDTEVCQECGCSPAVETLVLEQLKPLAIVENLRFL
ncbi:MAG: radical SAM protein [Candidatus Omnitrophota bacterium]